MLTGQHNDRPCLVVVAPFQPNSGFTRVLQSVLTELTDAYTIHWIGVSYRGQPFCRGGIRVCPGNPKGGDPYAAWQTKDLVDATGARIVLLLNDIWMLKNYVRALQDCRHRPAVVAWCPLDGDLVNDEPVRSLLAFDQLVTYTESARTQIRSAVDRLTAAGESGSLSRIDVIPHGVDLNTFAPAKIDSGDESAECRRRMARQILFPDRPELWDAFLVLNANRPIARKRIDLTIRGFAQFAKRKPASVRLFLHHAIASQSEREQIRQLASKSGIANRLVLSTDAAAPEGLSDDRLNLIYNACEIGVNTSTAEGWGLVSVEHGATGAAQIVPQHSACRDIWQGSAMMLPVRERNVPNYSLLQTATVSATDVAQNLEQLYGDRQLLHEMSMRARQVAERAEYSWKTISRQWREVLSRAVESAHAESRSPAS